MFELVYEIVPEYNYKESPVAFGSLKRLFDKVYEDFPKGKQFRYVQVYYITEINGKIVKYRNTCTPETLAQFSKEYIEKVIWRQFKKAVEYDRRNWNESRNVCNG
ncbi:hypothetical protein EC99P1_00036 [Enterococcus phage EC99P1]|nr:hypothetical protein EC99P1_00036 [Enterococcus phage EC99P1]